MRKPVSSKYPTMEKIRIASPLVVWQWLWLEAPDAIAALTWLPRIEFVVPLPDRIRIRLKPPDYARLPHYEERVCLAVPLPPPPSHRVVAHRKA
jgi:hypothetical protein